MEVDDMYKILFLLTKFDIYTICLVISWCDDFVAGINGFSYNLAFKS